VVRLPGRLLVAAAEVAFKMGLSPVGSDRAVFLTGPLVLAAGRFRVRTGWEALPSSAALDRFLRLVEGERLG
jgi:hypothetical protein